MKKTLLFILALIIAFSVWAQGSSNLSLAGSYDYSGIAQARQLISRWQDLWIP